jgi:hypothetical protein
MANMISLAYQEFNFSLWMFHPQAGSIFWKTLIFGMTTAMVMLAFFVSI